MELLRGDSSTNSAMCQIGERDTAGLSPFELSSAIRMAFTYGQSRSRAPLIVKNSIKWYNIAQSEIAG